MDAIAVVRELEQQGVIPQGEQDTITKTSSRKQQNEILFACLKRTCTKEVLMRACGIIIEVKGNPKMKSLGEDMKRRLETRKCCMHIHAGLLTMSKFSNIC